MRIALTGNPNSGKTTMYNALTGRNEKVGNWAGVTVEKKEHPIKKAYYSGTEELIAVDLPGAYSMSPFTSEESITSSYVRHEHPDAIINIVDATNLSRSLFFTTQLLELGIPVVVALNKSDINAKKQTTIDVAALSAKLGCPVVETVSISSEGLKAVVDAAVALNGKGQKAPYTQGDIDLTDKKVVEEADRKRFAFVNQIVSKVEKRKVLTREKGTGDAIDNILTNKLLGIPIFAVVMFLVFQISQVWVGPLIADTLVAWIETFQGYVTELLADANPLLTALLADGIIGGVGAVVGFLPLVMVSPADSELIAGGSDERRRFMDVVISQYDKEYLDALIRYNKALTQRNTLLKSELPVEEELFLVWEEMMAQAGEVVFKKREAFIKEFIPIFQSFYSFISQDKEQVGLSYDSHAREASLLEVLKQSRERDKIMGFSLRGIHKDELNMLLGEFPIKKEGSQGQNKTYLVALKLAQFDFLKRTGRTVPLLLLDDIFDKLDASRVEQIVKLVAGDNFGQIFITDTNREHLDRILHKVGSDYKMFFVEKGIIREMEAEQ